MDCISCGRSISTGSSDAVGRTTCSVCGKWDKASHDKYLANIPEKDYELDQRAMSMVDFGVVSTSREPSTNALRSRGSVRSPSSELRLASPAMDADTAGGSSRTGSTRQIGLAPSFSLETGSLANSRNNLSGRVLEPSASQTFASPQLAVRQGSLPSLTATSHLEILLSPRYRKSFTLDNGLPPIPEVDEETKSSGSGSGQDSSSRGNTDACEDRPSVTGDGPEYSLVQQSQQPFKPNANARETGSKDSRPSRSLRMPWQRPRTNERVALAYARPVLSSVSGPQDNTSGASELHPLEEKDKSHTLP